MVKRNLLGCAGKWSNQESLGYRGQRGRTSVCEMWVRMWGKRTWAKDGWRETWDKTGCGRTRNGNTDTEHWREERVHCSILPLPPSHRIVHSRLFVPCVFCIHISLSQWCWDLSSNLTWSIEDWCEQRFQMCLYNLTWSLLFDIRTFPSLDLIYNLHPVRPTGTSHTQPTHDPYARKKNTYFMSHWSL